MKTCFSPLLSLALFLTACSAAGQTTPKPVSVTPAQAHTLTVFAAASLTDAFSEIGGAFEAQHPGVKVQFNFAGSNTLRAQLEQGANPDVFASANTKEMDTVTTDGFIQPEAPRIFLTNKLVIVVPKGNPAKLETPEDLARPGVKVVLAAAEVPAGKYARQALEILSNVVSNETDVRQALAKVQLNEVDAGIVYASDAVAAPELEQIAIPAEYNVVAEYPIALLKKAPQPVLAGQFVDFVLSPSGQSTLKKWGFTPAN
jgi:molybdate transport system substrate-binding protein